MAEGGRVYWEAAPSQWYAEPKRLAALGLLAAEKGPGRTRERTHYTLTAAGRDALADWVRTPAPLPRMQHESIVRLLAADLVDPGAVRDGLRALGAELEDALQYVTAALGRLEEGGLAHRADLLAVNHRYACALLELQQRWLAEADAVLVRRGA